MKRTAFERLVARIKRSEGYRRDVYRCPAGKPTIGYGHNLEDEPLPEAMLKDGLDPQEADLVLRRDLEQAERDLLAAWPWMTGLDEARQSVLIDMCFNLGVRRLGGFRRMLTALQAKDFEAASAEMKDSKWATDVGDRDDALIAMMRTGRWPEDK